MTESAINLPDSVTHITVDGKEVYLVGTAHVSKESVEDVKATVEAVAPDTICVELCEGRHKSLTQKDIWKKMDIFKVIKEKKATFLLAQLVMTSFYKRLGDELGIQPGAEMLEGVRQAKETGAQLVPADRQIEITLRRVWGYLNFWNKLKLMSNLMAGVLFHEEVDEETIEKMKQQDQLEHLMEEFTKKFPGIKSRLIDERDIYLAQQIRRVKGEKIVAVVGAGHVQGMQEHIHEDEPTDWLMELPKKSIFPKILKWAIPLAIIGLLIFGFFKGGKDAGLESIYIWVLINGILAAIGSAVALAHPVTIISAFIAAPLTSLNPFFAAGWIAGLVQACIKRPKVKDFENLPEAIKTVKGFWTNAVTKILLVVALANLGSTLGTIIAGFWIGARSL